MSDPSPRRTRGVLLPVVLATVGGLLLAGGTTASWVVDAATRQVEGLAVPTESATNGLTFAPLALPVGAAAVLTALVLPVTRGRSRVVAAVLLGVLGLGGVVIVVVGTLRAIALDGGLGGGPAVAGLGGLAVAAAGALAGRRPAPLLDQRYSVEADPADAEWDLSSKDPGQ